MARELDRPSTVTPEVRGAVARRGGWLRPLRLSGDAWRHLLILLACVLTFYPFAQLVVMSLKPPDQFQTVPFGLIFPFYLGDNYTAAWQPITPFFLNSIIYSGESPIGVLPLPSFPAYVFARFRFPA